MKRIIEFILSLWIGAIITLFIGAISEEFFDYKLLWFDFTLLTGFIASVAWTAYLVYFDNPVAPQIDSISNSMIEYGFNYSDWRKVLDQIKERNLIDAIVALPHSDSSKLQNNRAQITLLSQNYSDFQFTLTFPTKVALLRLKRKT